LGEVPGCEVAAFAGVLLDENRSREAEQGGALREDIEEPARLPLRPTVNSASPVVAHNF